MAVEDWPKIAERVVRQHGGEPYTGKGSAGGWTYILGAAGTGTIGRSVLLGQFCFAQAPHAGWEREVEEALRAEDVGAELFAEQLGRPRE